MKILHTADWHLMSPMEHHLTAEKAAQRRRELLSRFADMVRYAREHQVSAVLLAGDLSDSGALSFSVQDYLLSLIFDAAEDGISFYLVAGNHDRDRTEAVGGAFTRGRCEMPPNLFVFDTQWKTYTLAEGITISGKALCGTEESIEIPCMDEDGYHIVMLHGILQEYDGAFGGADDRIPMTALQNKNIDYLALGHLHTFRHGKLDKRGTYCYPGCPEGRGFDECGDKGFVMLHVDGGSANAEFVPFAKRRLHRISLDITEIPCTIHALEQALTGKIEALPQEDLIRVTVCGEDEPDAVRDFAYMQKRLEERFFFAEIRDERTVKIDIEAFRHDVSLRGEFVRRVLSAGLSDKETQQVLRCGLAALKGELQDV